MFELRNPNDRQENLDILKTDLVFESDMITTLQLPGKKGKVYILLRLSYLIIIIIITITIIII